jgi:hypothetical protein
MMRREKSLGFLKKIPFIFSMIFSVSFFSQAKVFAFTESEDISLPDELKRSALHVDSNDDASAFDDCRIHGGASFINSFQDFAVSPGVRDRGGIRGLELNLGIDMFTPRVIAEGVLLYFPEAQIEDAHLSSNAFELRMLYDNHLFDGVTFHLGAGISSRTYNVKIKPSTLITSPSNSDHSFSSGATALVSGLDYWPSPDVSVGVELTNHLPLANGDDPSSVDLGIKLNGHF